MKKLTMRTNSSLNLENVGMVFPLELINGAERHVKKIQRRKEYSFFPVD